jgi:hypothetical protein
MIARSTGAAPRQRRQQRGLDVQKPELRQQRLAQDSAPKAHTTTTSGRASGDRARASVALTLSGWSRSIPSRAASATGGGGERAAATGRAVGAGDDEDRAVRRLRQALEHARGERRRAEEETVLKRRFAALAQDAHGLLALVARRAVEDEHAVEVVQLVLDHARLEARRLHEQRLAVAVARLHADVDGALDVDVDTREAETCPLPSTPSRRRTTR